MRQLDKLADFLTEHGSATGMDIINLGIMNYKGRICDLRQLGFDIRTVMETGENRFGEPIRYARYVLRARP